MLNEVRCYTFIKLTSYCGYKDKISVVHVNDLIEVLRIVSNCLQEIDTIMILGPPTVIFLDHFILLL